MADDWIIEALREAAVVARHQANTVAVLLGGMPNTGKDWLDKYGDRVQALVVSTSGDA